MSGFKLSWGGSWRSPANIRLSRNGGWYAPSNIYVKSNGQWVKIWPIATDATVSVPLQPTYFFNNSVNFIDTAASISGGVGPFTYQWTLTDVSPVVSALTLYGSTTGPGVVVRSMGSNRINNATLTVAVTDQGNGNKVSYGSAYIDAQHGIPV